MYSNAFFKGYQKELIKACNCTEPDFLTIFGDDIDICESESQTKCLNIVYSATYLNDSFLQSKTLNIFRLFQVKLL